jgi:hypothetical protein
MHNCILPLGLVMTGFEIREFVSDDIDVFVFQSNPYQEGI